MNFPLARPKRLKYTSSNKRNLERWESTKNRERTGWHVRYTEKEKEQDFRCGIDLLEEVGEETAKSYREEEESGREAEARG